MDRTKALTNLENWYCDLKDPEVRAFMLKQIRSLYIPSYAEDLIRHLEKVSQERKAPV